MFALTAAATTKFGPVLVSVPGTHHGVHVGDVLLFVFAGAWVVLGDPQRSRGRESRSED